MDWGFVGAAFGALALVGVGFQIVSYFREHPKRRLEYTVKSRPLVIAARGATLEVKVDGVEVKHPHLVEFRLVSNSRADVPSSAFDAGKPLKIRVEPGGALVLADGVTGTIESSRGEGYGWEWAEFRVEPQLIRKASQLTLNLVSSGKPTVTVSSPLIDVPVWDVTKRPDRNSLLMIVFFLTLSVGIVSVTAWQLVTGAVEPDRIGVTIFNLVLYGVFAVASGALLVVTLRWRSRSQAH